MLTFHRCDAIAIRGRRVTGVYLTDVRRGASGEIECKTAVIAAGPWSARIAEAAGAKLSAGARTRIHGAGISAYLTMHTVKGSEG